MIGSRYPVMLLCLFQLLVVAAFGHYLLESTKQHIAEDQLLVMSELRQQQSWDQQQLRSALKRHPVQFAQIFSPDSVKPWTFGQIKGTTHPLSKMLDDKLLQDEFKIGERQVTIGMDTDYYLEKHSAGMIPILIALTLTFLLFSVLLISGGRRQRANLNALENAVARLPSLDLPSIIEQIRGPFQPLARTIIATRDQLKLHFTKLQKTNADQVQESMTDPVTSLANRAAFNLDMEQTNSKPTSHGFLMMVRANGLDDINTRLGNQSGDDFLSTVASYLHQLVAADNRLSLYRYSSTDFLLRLPNIVEEDALPLLEPLSRQFAELADRESMTSTGYIGLVPYQHKDRVSQLLIQLDTAISIAQAEGPNGYFYLEPDLMDFDIDNDRWQAVIEDVISNNRIEFTQQPIVAVGDDNIIYQELFARFTNKDGNQLPTQTLLAMASKNERTIELDKMIFNTVVREIQNNGNPKHCYGLNLATHSVTNNNFLKWLEERITRTPGLSGRLILEISERSIDLNPTQLVKWFQRIHGHGIRISIDRFGNGLTSFRSLQALKPDFVKLAPEFTKNIDKDSNNRFFVKMVLDISVRLEIRVIGTHIERYEERIALEDLRIDGLQGHLLSAPTPFKVLQV
ncbi:EAL domain-containing protein [Ferrimonas lipolytica]|uniref:GGDEF domain-containing protein n=1 Tax=Ferrimonas lipolytica TaxID=2724191 RepID=A0A6H1UAY1_9GAMM|nr:GGDEF domain-containing protein [Ferrimonas lipolytica]QIZ76211.1 GGDEF domain-containing protein [Ferrimonas lipolytica]